MSSSTGKRNVSPSKDANGSAAKKGKQSLVTPLSTKAVNTVRVLCADMVQKANSGHPGAPMSLAPLAYLLWTQVMKYNPKDPQWLARDRFVLSNGHACALLYAMLHLTGYAQVTMDALKAFRQVDSITAGHPENTLIKGVEVSTGPLGQGISNAVGLAMAEMHLGAVFNKSGHAKIVDNYTYVICGDGCLQEGVSSEASSLAGHLGLGRLIVFYDDNQITIDGDTALSFTEDVAKRYEAYGWHVQTLEDVQDLDALLAATEAAKAETDRPSMIKIRTRIGFGSKKEGSHSVHGSPLGAEDLKQLKSRFGFDPEQAFVVPTEVAELFQAAGAKGAAAQAAWNTAMEAYKGAFPAEASELVRCTEHRLPEGWREKLPRYTPEDKAMATRKFSEIALNVLAPMLPELVGGSADLTPSTLTALACSGDFQKKTPDGRYVRFGVREHGMTALANGMFAYGALRPFVATFLNFIGYAWGAVRLSCLSHLGVIFVMTHDSIGLGEDGPTHQPVETLEQIRAMPNLHLLRPADGNEVSGAYISALEHPYTPSVLALSRQNLPNLEGTSAEKTLLGAYVLAEMGGSNGGGGAPELILTGSGSEVAIAVEAAKTLAETVRVRVVSFPSWELFDQQNKEYRLSVFPAGVPVVSVEASATHGWAKYSHAALGLTWFGASGPYAKVYAKYGLTADNLVSKAREVLAFYAGDRQVPSLIDVPFISKQLDHKPVATSHA
ncbi:transketolase [Nannochloropsis gaditana]|uniref:transketolase n=1 Tax=Nannochloropsis gaditana TaxID=72520 RepID=W7TM64_9STRA|nr:transketolase [Nannochloropsis gaditana]